MKSIKQLYKIGYGPSSSHTIAPYRFGEFYINNFGICDKYDVRLCGSLALTASGHGTINILKSVLESDNLNISLDINEKENIIELTGYKDNIKLDTWHGISLGGGAISISEYDTGDELDVYSEKNFNDIKRYIIENNCSLIEYAYSHEPDLKQHLKACLKVMFDSVDRGINTEGLLNEELNYYRVARKLIKKAKNKNDFLVAYSYAVCEENAAGNMMCTAPTLGACGILASLMYYLRFNEQVEIDTLCDLLTIAGIFGNCIKENASIAGSTGGCQAEVGTACSMAAAAITYYYGSELKTIEYAAEMGIEHFLGLTCDPVKGYVIIPCIERNAISILKAFDCSYLARQLNNVKDNAVSFDSVVHAMNYTGSKIVTELKETSLGGLSLEFKNE